MKKIIRLLFIGIFATIAFLIAIVAIFAATFDPNAYKQDLSELVREQTGRDLQFHGDVDLTFFPALGMRLGALSLSNAQGFGAQPMIKVSEVSVSVDLASLVSFSPEIDRLVLRDLEVDLQRNAAGVTNWDDLLPPAESGSDSAAASTTSEDSSAEGGGDFELRGAFGGLDLQNIQLSWRDQQAGTEYRITDLDLSTGRIEPNQPFPLSLEVVVSGDVDVTLKLETLVEYLFAQQRLTLSELQLALNEFTIGGELQLSDFRRSTPRLRFALESPELGVDGLLGIAPAQAAGPEPATPEADAQAAADSDTRISLPMETLRGLDIDGSLAIASIKAQNLQMSDLDITLKANNGVLSLKPLKLVLYDGSVDAAVVVDVRGQVPRYGIDKSLAGVQIGALLRDFTGEETLSGGLDANANLTTSGEWVSALRRNSNGTLSLAFADGAINGFNLRHSIDVAKARLGGKEPPTQENLKTDFSALSLSGVIEDGVFSSDDLKLLAPLLRVGGEGSADLAAETVDYLVNVKLVGTVEGQAGEAADELSGLEIPVSIEGPFQSAKIDVLLDEMLKARAAAEKEKLKAEIEAEKEALKRELEAEKKALEEAKRREAEKKLEVEKAKLEAKADKEKEKLKDKMLEKLQD